MLGERRLRAGMDRPTEIEGWWLAVLWVADEDGIVACRAAAPTAGPPPDPPLLRLGPLCLAVALQKQRAHHGLQRFAVLK